MKYYGWTMNYLMIKLNHSIIECMRKRWIRNSELFHWVFYRVLTLFCSIFFTHFSHTYCVTPFANKIEKQKWSTPLPLAARLHLLCSCCGENCHILIRLSINGMVWAEKAITLNCCWAMQLSNSGKIIFLLVAKVKSINSMWLWVVNF